MSSKRVINEQTAEEQKDIVAPTDHEEAGGGGEVLAESESPTEQVAEVPPLIYLGPNLPGGRMLHSTVFRGGIPEYLKPLLEERPDVAELIVPVEEMAGVQARISQKGTAEHAAYQAIGKGN